MWICGHTQSDFESLATGRLNSCFLETIESNYEAIYNAIAGRRIAIIGAAGSIGFAVLKSLLAFRPAGIALVDLSENNLVEVVRELRSSPNLAVPDDFTALPIGLGSLECQRFFQESQAFDYVYNLCAIKHVRSEKNVFCLARMFDTNVLFLHEFLEYIPYDFNKFFTVSSDKAANPANLMGASKMVMEEMLRCQSRPFSTARFANVAFSNGSLPYGFLQRIQKQQPLSAPCDVKRYFMSHEEAGQICLLSSALGEYADVFFPSMKESLNEKTFSEIAYALLEKLGYEPVECQTEEEAKKRTTELIPARKWPCYFFHTDTTGEKPFEEFYSRGESIDFSKFKNIGVVKRDQASTSLVLEMDQFLSFIRAAKRDSALDKNDYVEAVRKIVPGLHHIETNKNLDHRM